MKVILLRRLTEKSTLSKMGFLTPKSNDTCSNRTMVSPRCTAQPYHALYIFANVFYLKIRCPTYIKQSHPTLLPSSIYMMSYQKKWSEKLLCFVVSFFLEPQPNKGLSYTTN